MKPRARRVTIGAAVLGAVLVAVLVVSHWSIACDHLEAWRFQMTRETTTIEPLWDETRTWHWREFQEVDLYIAAKELRSPVIFAPRELPSKEGRVWLTRHLLERTGDDIRSRLQKLGWRLIEQRFPRRAYVAIQGARGMTIKEAEMEAALSDLPEDVKEEAGTERP